MKRPRKAPDIPLDQLRFSDLIREPSRVADHRFVNVKVPADVLQRVHAVARRLGVSKGAAIIALVNEGLQEAKRHGVGAQTKAAPQRR